MTRPSESPLPTGHLQPDEAWRPIELAGGRYEISDKGRVRGPSGKVLKPTLLQIGYYSVALSLRNHTVVRHYVHRLVAEAFIGPLSDTVVVNHRNGDKLDNRLDNLEIIDRAGNGRHWAASGRSAKAGRKRTGYCGRGHAYPQGSRFCAQCQRLRKAGHVFQPPDDTEWRQSSVPGYLISADGRVWSHKTSRVLKHGVNVPGYRYVNIREERRTRPVAIHRLVAEAFLGGVTEESVIDHLNGDKQDNRVVNLRVTTRADNIRAFRDTRRASGRHGVKYDELTIGELKWLLSQGGHTQAELAARVGMSRSHVNAIALGRKWGHVPPRQPTSS
jgi:hypothetical protein